MIFYGTGGALKLQAPPDRSRRTQCGHAPIRASIDAYGDEVFNGRSALIDTRGSIVWSCVPRFDGDPVFHALLDSAEGIGQEGTFAVEIEVVPSVKGRATIHDKDILIYCTSQIMAALNAKDPMATAARMREHFANGLMAASSTP